MASCVQQAQSTRKYHARRASFFPIAKCLPLPNILHFLLLAIAHQLPLQFTQVFAQRNRMSQRRRREWPWQSSGMRKVGALLAIKLRTAARRCNGCNRRHRKRRRSVITAADFRRSRHRLCRRCRFRRRRRCRFRRSRAGAAVAEPPPRAAVRRSRRRRNRAPSWDAL